MRLSLSVLGILRGGLAGASLAVAAGCGVGSEPSTTEPAATLAPLSRSEPAIAAPSPLALPPPSVGMTLVPTPPIVLIPVAPLPPAAPAAPTTTPTRPRRPVHALPPAPPNIPPDQPMSLVGPGQPDWVARPACGRG